MYILYMCCHCVYIESWIKRQTLKWGIPARSGRGTPPTNMVFLGSRGWDPSITKSLSFRFHGRIWTCRTQKPTGLSTRNKLLLIKSSQSHNSKFHRIHYDAAGDVSMCAFVCVPTDRLVFDGGAGHTEVQLAVLFDAGIDQSLHRALILEQQEGVAYTKYSRVIHAAGDAQCWQSHIGI